MSKRRVNYYIPLLQCSMASAGRGVQIADRMFLRGDGESILHKMSKRFRTFIGEVEVGLIKDHQTLAHGEIELDDEDDIDLALFAKMAWLSSFLTALWVIQDNSISFDVGFADEPLRQKARKRVWPDDGHITDAGVMRGECVLDQGILRNTRDLHHALFGDFHIDDERCSEGYLDKYEIVHPDGSRLSRALYFVNAARRSSYRSAKIAYYCSAFEALLSSNDTEMTHRLSEIVAWLLGDSCSDRIHIYKQMKMAYSIRSKVVHGDKVTNRKIRELNESVMFCDRTLRVLISRIVEDDALQRAVLGTVTEFEDAMSHITFGGNGVTANHKPRTDEGPTDTNP